VDASIQLNVRDNGYDFIEESLRYAVMAEDYPPAWKFAIILAAQGIELLLKARLEQEHPLLVMADPDHARSAKTVGLEAALARLAAAGVAMEEEDVRRLRSARRVRNEFMHYKVDATPQQVEATFRDLFEFAHVFHLEALGGELHDHLNEDLYPVEAQMIERFRRDFVIYQGSEVVRRFPAEIVDAQFALRVIVDGVAHDRVRYGDASDLMSVTPEGPCHDCSVLPGQLHAFMCDAERCPACLGQSLSCDCDWSWESVEEIDHFVPRAGGSAPA
jgi:hypothetical protein